jgi:hypothetical protein
LKSAIFIGDNRKVFDKWQWHPTHSTPLLNCGNLIKSSAISSVYIPIND